MSTTHYTESSKAVRYSARITTNASKNINRGQGGTRNVLFSTISVKLHVTKCVKLVLISVLSK